MGKRVLLTSPLCRVVGGKVGGPFPTHSFNPLHRLSFASSLDVTTLTVTARRVFTFYLRNYTRANRICVPTNPESEVRLQVVGHIFPPPTDQTPAMVSQCSMPFSTFYIFSISLAEPAAYIEKFSWHYSPGFAFCIHDSFLTVGIFRSGTFEPCFSFIPLFAYAYIM